MFDSQVDSDLGFLTPVLSADATSVSLVLMRNGFSFADRAAAPNDKAAAAAIESLGPGNPLYEAALNLPDDEIAGAFSGMGGDVHLATPSTLIATTTTLAGQVTDHLDQSFDALGAGPAPSAYAASAGPTAASGTATGVWGAVYGLRTDASSDAGQPASVSASGGLVGGADSLVGDWRIGVMLEAGAGGSEMAGLDASIDTTSYGAGLYAGREWGDTRLLFGGSLAGHGIHSTRSVNLPDAQTLEADYDAATAMAFAELSQRIDLGAVELTPRLGLSHVRYGSDGFSETGGAAALTGEASVLDATFTTLGLDLGRQFAFGDGTLLTATGTIGWRHAVADAPAADHAFAGGDAFTVYGSPQPADALVLGADLAFDLDESSSVDFGYAGEHAGDTTTQSLTASWNGSF
jgi:outer membrane autotransporter protein